MIEVGSLVRHYTSGAIGIVVYISPDQSHLHHIEVWIPIYANTVWWAKSYTEVICR